MKRTLTVVAGATIIALGSSTIGYAAGQVTSRDVADDSLLSKDLRDGKAVGLDDLRPAVANKLADLEQRIAALEAQGADGSIRPAVWRDAQPDDASTVTIGATAITVELDPADTPPAGAGASAETNDLGVAVQAGDVIAFDLAPEPGTVCAASNLRMFVEVNGNFINSADGNPDACGGDDGRVEFAVPSNGRIGQAGFVNDGNAPGTATFSNLTIDGQVVGFTS